MVKKADLGYIGTGRTMLADAYLQLVQTVLKHKACVTDGLTQEGKVVSHLLSQ